MEHRWGQRIAVDIPLRFTLAGCSLLSIGRLTNVSLSGALISRPFDLRVLARLQVFFELPRAKHLTSATAAFVARRSAQGIGLEWCESSLPPCREKLAEIDDPVKREEFLKAVAHGSAAAWEHVKPFGRIRSVGGKIQRLGRNRPPLDLRAKSAGRIPR